MMACVALIDNWMVEYRPGGWARASSGTGLKVYLRLCREDDRPRLRICLAAVTGDRPLTEAVWRSVPIADIETHLTTFTFTGDPRIDDAKAALAEPVEIDGFSLEALERFFEETQPLHVRGVIPGRTTVDGTPLAERFNLVKPSDGRLSDEFLRNVAGVYLATVEAKRAPAPAIAAMAGVPVRTVHRWVTEARRRGYLPPATKGRAG
jgi:hypothetical protein